VKTAPSGLPLSAVAAPADRLRRRITSHPGLAIFLGALVLRLAVVILLPNLVKISDDTALRYTPLADALLHGQGFSAGGRPSAAAPPLYPVLLAVTYAVFGHSLTVVRGLLALLDAASCTLLFAVADRIVDRRTAVVAGIAMAGCPYLVYSLMLAATDTLFVFLNTLFLFVFVLALTVPARRRFLACGGLLGLAALCRATAVLLPFAMAPVTLVALRRSWLRGATRAALLLLGWGLVVAPWTVRNYIHFKHLVPIQTLGGYHLLLASVPPEQLRHRHEKLVHPTGGWGTVTRDRAYYRAALRRIAADPLGFVRLMAGRLWRMWYLTHSGRFRTFLKVANTLLLGLAAWGVWLHRRKWPGLLPLFAILAYYVAVHTVIFAIFRYLLPTVPVLVMLAALPLGIGLARLAERVRSAAPESASLPRG
jgi:4-amino-4-deoxy-L-arabinose transferase-like glycosyltransferase